MPLNLTWLITTDEHFQLTLLTQLSYDSRDTSMTLKHKDR